jgi:hypothetical protein
MKSRAEISRRASLMFIFNFLLDYFLFLNNYYYFFNIYIFSLFRTEDELENLYKSFSSSLSSSIDNQVKTVDKMMAKVQLISSKFDDLRQENLVLFSLLLLLLLLLKI